MTKFKNDSIETKRLIIRPFKIEDAKAMFDNWANDKEVTKYLEWEPISDVKQAEEMVEEWIQKMKEIDNYFQWVIILKENNEVVGNIAYFEDHEIGYCLSKKYWNQKIASESLKAVIDYLFTKTDCEEIWGSHYLKNSVSGKVMEKCNMKFIKQEDAIKPRNGETKMNFYKITKQDFLKLK